MKYGFRYVTAEEWGRLRRLFARRARAQVGRAALLAALRCSCSRRSPTRSSTPTASLAARARSAALMPLVQAPEAVAGAALLLRGRYDLRGGFFALSMAAAPRGVAVGASVRRDGGGGRRSWSRRRSRPRRDRRRRRSRLCGASPPPPPETAGRGRSAGSARVRRSARARRRGRLAAHDARAARCLGVVAPGPGRLFRAAQAPHARASRRSRAPVRMILLTEQTRDVESGRDDLRLSLGVRRYSSGAAALLVAALSRRLAADAVSWCGSCSATTSSRPPTPARHRARRGLDPARVRLDEVVPGLDRAAEPADRHARGRDGRAAARSCSSSARAGARPGRRSRVLVATVRLRARLGVLLARAAPQPLSQVASSEDGGRREGADRRGIWPPDVGGPASHAPEVGRVPARARPRGRGRHHRRGRPGAAALPGAAGSRRRCRRDPARRAAALVARRARRADVVYTTGMFGRSALGARARAAAVRRQADRRPGLRARCARAGWRADDVEAFQQAARASGPRARRAARDRVLRGAAHVFCPSAYLRELVDRLGRRRPSA